MIRKPAVSGLFYPDSKNILEEMIGRFLESVPLHPNVHQISAILCPHAGYVYSGQVAAEAFGQIRSLDIETIILLGPSHYVPFRTASVFDGDGFETPLGIYPIDREWVNELIGSHPSISFYPPAHEKEHSLEVMVPFLQIVCPKAKIVPVVLGSHYTEDLSVLAAQLAEGSKKRRTLTVISTDLSHFHSAEIAEKKDRRSIELIKRQDMAALAKSIYNSEAEMCGFSAIYTAGLMMDFFGSMTIKEYSYTHSGALTGDNNQVVGYTSMGYYKD